MYPWKHPSAIQNTLQHLLAQSGHKAGIQRQWLDSCSCEVNFERLLIYLIDYLILLGLKDFP